jgi:hypothetical protein
MKKADLIAYTVDEYAASEENAAKLTQIPIVDMTTDKLADLRLEIAKLGAALEDLRQLVPTDVYTARLSVIK